MSGPDALLGRRLGASVCARALRTKRYCGTVRFRSFTAGLRVGPLQFHFSNRYGDDKRRWYWDCALSDLQRLLCQFGVSFEKGTGCRRQHIANHPLIINKHQRVVKDFKRAAAWGMRKPTEESRCYRMNVSSALGNDWADGFSHLCSEGAGVVGFFRHALALSRTWRISQRATIAGLGSSSISTVTS